MMSSTPIRGAVTMEVEDSWAKRAKGTNSTEIVRRGLSYDGLSERLAASGGHDSSANVWNKLIQGKFTAAFTLLCLVALWCKLPAVTVVAVPGAKTPQIPYKGHDH